MQTFQGTQEKEKDEEEHVLATDVDKNDSCTTEIEEYYRTARNAVDWILYGLHYDTSMSLPLACFLIFVEALQWASFAFFPPNLFDWRHEWSNWASLMTDYSVNFLGQNMSGYYAAVALTFAYYVLAALAVWAQRFLRWTWPMTGYRQYISVFLRPLLLPIVGAHARMLFGCLSTTEGPHTYYNVTCGEPKAYVFMVLSAVCIVLFCFVAFVVAMCFVELNPNQRVDLGDKLSAFARSSGRGDALNTLSRAICVIFYVVFVQFATPEWPLATLLLVAGLVNLYYQVWMLPYFHRWVQIFSVWQTLVPTWCGICVMINRMQLDNHYGGLLLVYCMWPVLFLFSIFLVQARTDQIISYSTLMLTTPELFELKARLSLYEGIRTFGLDRPWTTIDSEQAVFRTQLYKEIEKLYQLGVKRFPTDPWLHIHFSSYYSHFVHNKPMAFREIVAATPNATAPDERFFLFLMRARSNVESALQRTMDAQVKSYTEFKDRAVVATNASRTAARTMLEIWTELMRAAPNTDRLVRLAGIARAATLTAFNNYKRLIEINPNSITMLRCFGGFVLDFNGDISMSSQLLHRADELEEARSNMVTNASTEYTLFALQRTHLDIYDERNAVVSISLEKDSFANIMSCNAAFRRATGYNMASELLSHNINMIIPEPVRTVHDNILNAFLQRNHSDILNTTRVALCVHKRGHVFPLDVNLRWADATMSRIIGVMKPAVMEDEQLIFDKVSDHVNYCTLNCYALFGISREMVLSKDVHISGVFPHLSIHRANTGKDRRRREFLLACANSPQGLILPARNFADGHLFLVRLWMYTLQVHDVFFCVCRVNRKVEREHLLSNANVIGFSEAERLGHGILELEADEVTATISTWRWRRPEDKFALKLTTRGWVEARSSGQGGNEFDRNMEMELSTAARCVEDYSESALNEALEAHHHSAGSEEDEDDEHDSDEDSHDEIPGPITTYSFVAGMGQRPTTKIQTAAPGRSQTLTPMTTSVWRNITSPGNAEQTVTSPSGVLVKNRAHFAKPLTGADGTTSSLHSNVDESSSEGSASDDGDDKSETNSLHNNHNKSGHPTKAQQRLAASAINLVGTKSLLKKPKALASPTSGDDDTASDKALLKNLRAGALGSPSEVSEATAVSVTKRASDPLLNRGGYDDSGSDGDSANHAGGSMYSESSSGSSALDSDNKIAGNRHVLNFIREQNAINDRLMSRSHFITFCGLLVMMAIMIAMYVVTTQAIADNEHASELLTNACHRRHISMNLFAMTGALELTRLGFYDSSYFDFVKSRLTTIIDWFSEIDSQLYNEKLTTREGRDFYTIPSIDFKVLVGGQPHIRKYNLREYSQAYIAAATNVLNNPVELMDSQTEPYMYMMTQNALTTAPEAYRKPIEYMKDAIDNIYRDLLVMQIVVFVLGVVIVFIVVGVVNETALGKAHEQSSDVQLLFLSLPKAVVKLLQKRFATALKNQSDDEEESEVIEFTKNNHNSSAHYDDTRDDLSDSSTSLSSSLDTEYTDGSGAKAHDTGAHVGLSVYLSRHRVSKARQEHLLTSLLHARLLVRFKYAVLITFILIYVIVMLVTLDQVRAHNEIAMGDIEQSTVRTHSLAAWRYYSRRWTAGLDPVTSTYGLDYLHLAEEAGLTLLYTNTRRFQGTHDVPQRNFMFEDCCTPLLGATKAQVPMTELDEVKVDCATFLGNFMANGLQEAYATFSYLAQRLTSPLFHGVLGGSLTANAGNPAFEPVGSPKYNAVNDYLTQLFLLARSYVETGLAYSTALYGSHAYLVNNDFGMFCRTWFACWVSAIVAYYLLIIRPIYSQTHESVRAAHALMLAIPPDVTMKVAQVSKFLQDAFEHSLGVTHNKKHDTNTSAQ